MEASLYAEFLSATWAVAGLAALLATAMAGVLFAYVADEEANRRRLDWLEEPLAIAPEAPRAEVIPLRKAA
jgi:hypothetical protein